MTQIIPDHVQKAMDENWKNWCLVPTSEQNRYHQGLIENHKLREKLKKYEQTRRLTWRERISGAINPMIAAGEE